MTQTLRSLRTTTSDAAHEFFASVPASDLVADVIGIDDDELQALLSRPEVRVAAAPGILDRLGDYAIPERLAEVKGTVRFELSEAGRPLVSQALAFADGVIEHVSGERAEAADVVVRTSVWRFVRIVSGQLNAGLEYVAGHLDVDGDALLALAAGGLYRVPGTDVPVDPTDLEPVEVSEAIAVASGPHLRKVMAGGFRPVVLGEIFRRLPDFVNARKARGVRLVVGFRLTGASGGAVERYVVHLADGVAVVTEGDPGDGARDRDATITCDATDFLKLALGHLNPVTGVLKGQLKVRGDRAAALQFSSVMQIPRPRR